MRNIVITGANGFVGSYLVNLLDKTDDNVIALVRNGSRTDLIENQSLVVMVDYEDSLSLTNIISSADVIVHCAGLTKARRQSDYQKVNVGLTKKFVEIVNSLERRIQFILLSSQAAAGMATKGRLKKEEDDCKPLTFYGQSKLDAEEYVRSDCNQPWTIIRPVSVYGPGDKDFFEYFKLVESHLGLVIGHNKLANFVFVKELCEFIMLSIGNKKAYNELFFVNDGKAYFQEDFVDTLSEVMGGYMIKIHIPEITLYPVAIISEVISFFTDKAVLINLQKVKEFKGENWLCSIDKARSILGYKPCPNLKKNIEDTLNWYKENEWL